MINRAPLIAALSAFAVTGVAAPSQAQYAATQAPAILRPDMQLQTRTPAPAAPPVFRLFGVPVRLAAPVPPPYSNAAYDTFGGQPATGADQIMSQTFTGQPAAPNPN